MTPQEDKLREEIAKYAGQCGVYDMPLAILMKKVDEYAKSREAAAREELADEIKQLYVVEEDDLFNITIGELIGRKEGETVGDMIDTALSRLNGGKKGES